MSAAAEPRRRLKPEQRRALIVEAAAAEFGRRGHRDARMEDIARAAGTTKAVLYDHFPSKGALHAEILKRASEELTTTVVAAVVEVADRDPETRFRVGMHKTFEVIRERPDVRGLLLGDIGGDVKVAKASVKAQRGARASMTAVFLSDPTFLEGAPDRERRAQHVVQGVMGTVNGLAALGVEQDLTPEEQTDLLMALVWPGIDSIARAWAPS
jgi:AcrR family transcriptional regulator